MTEDIFEKDPTWAEAKRLLDRRYFIPKNVLGAIQGGWGGIMGYDSFVRTLGFTGLNLWGLNRAIEQGVCGTDVQVPETIRDSIRFLGLTLTAALVGIIHTFETVNRSKPPPAWNGLSKEILTSIEVAQKFGNRVPSFGVPASLVVGFARFTGPIVFMLHDSRAYRNWNLTRGVEANRKAQLDSFGCEAYQVSSLAVQRLGYGVEASLGIALGAGSLDPRHLEIGPAHLRWKAAVQWIDALREGRSVPRENEMRDFFDEIRPGIDGKNESLTTLYTEVNKVKGTGSLWTWPISEKTEAADTEPKE